MISFIVDNLSNNMIYNGEVKNFIVKSDLIVGGILWFILLNDFFFFFIFYESNYYG